MNLCNTIQNPILFCNKHIKTCCCFNPRPKNLDFYMKKAFSTIVQEINPEIIVFLGDLMDGGREIKTELKYLKEFRRFNHIFKTESKKFYMAGKQR